MTGKIDPQKIRDNAEAIARCVEEITAEREDAKARGHVDVVRRREEILSVFRDAMEIADRTS